MRLLLLSDIQGNAAAIEAYDGGQEIRFFRRTYARDALHGSLMAKEMPHAEWYLARWDP